MIYLVDRQTYAITESRETHSRGRYIVCQTLEHAQIERDMALRIEISLLENRIAILEGLRNYAK